MKRFLQDLYVFILSFVKNPHCYPAAVLAFVIGAVAGAGTGIIAAVNLESIYHVCTHCQGAIYGLDVRVILSGLVGLMFGALAGGALIALLVILKTHYRTKAMATLHSEHLMMLLAKVFSMSIELAVALLLGAVAGAFISPGFGALFGAVLGVFLMSVFSFFRQKLLKK